MSTPGELAKESGMGLALTRTGIDWWRATVRRMVVNMPSGQLFTADDVIAHAGLPTGSEVTNANNAVGAMINGMARSGLISKTSARVRSTRTAGHAREIAVWRRT